MSTPTPKKDKKIELAKEVAKILAPELNKAVDNKVAPIMAEITSIKKDLINEIKALQQTAPTPATAQSGLTGKITVNGQTIDLSNLAGEITKVLPNVNPQQLQAALTGQGGGGGGAPSAPTQPLEITLPNGQKQQVNLGGLQALMQVLQMFGFVPNQQQQQGNASWINEAVQREILDDLAFGSSIKRAVAGKIMKGVGDDLGLNNYLNFNNTMIQEPLSKIRQQAAAPPEGAPNASPS